MAQLIWLWGCPTYAQKQAKNAFLVFLGCFWAYVRQPHSHKSWDKPMPFASINSTNPRTNPWNFLEKYWELAELENEFFFLRRPFWFFFSFFFFLFSIKNKSKFIGYKGLVKILSSQTWRHFLTHAKHFEGECTVSYNVNIYDVLKGRIIANLLYIPLGNSGVVIPDFHLFGGHDELLFFGDNEDEYENSLAR